MPLRFRNLTVTPDDPVTEWGGEGMLIAIERGGVSDWQKLVRTVAADPDGEAGMDLRQALDVADSPSSVAAVRLMLQHATRSARDSVVDRLQQAFLATELTQARAAAMLDTSASRLNTYLTGKVMPSAEFLARLENLADKRMTEVRG